MRALAFRDVARQKDEAGCCAWRARFARSRQFEPGGPKTRQVQHNLPSGRPALGLGLFQHVHHRQRGQGGEHIGHVAPDQLLGGGHKQFGTWAVDAVVAAINVKLKQGVGNGVDGGPQLLLSGLHLGGALGHLKGQPALMHLQDHEKAGQIGHEQRKQQTQGTTQRQYGRCSPAIGRRQTQRPLPVGQS